MHGHISITPADITAGVAIVTAGFMFKDYTPKTTYNYCHAGGKNIDEAILVLNQKRDGQFIIPDAERLDQQERYNMLIEERLRLEQDNRTYTGSLKNWNSARQFYRDTTFIYDETRTLSSRHRGLADTADIQARLNENSEVGRFQGYTHDNSGSVHLPVPIRASVSHSGYCQSTMQDGYASRGTPRVDNRNYNLPDQPYATYRG